MIALSPLKIAIAAGFVALSVSACQTGAPAGVGTVGGAVVGGLAGSAIGSGSGRTAAIIGGSLLGGYVGNRTIDRRRYDRYHRHYRRRY